MSTGTGAESTGLPHLLQLLEEGFAAEGHQPDKATAAEFTAFARRYLNQHRTVENWPADRNIGLRLSNNRRCLVHPPTEAGSGRMQESGAVGVTHGQTQPGQEGVCDGQAKAVF